MTNEILWLVLLLVNFTGIIIAYRFFGKAGLYSWMAMAIILANIQVLKIVSFFGLVTAMGNIIYGTTFLVTDILNENYGKKEAQKAVYIGLFVLMMTTIIMQISITFVPHAFDELSPALSTVFSLLPRIAFASFAAFIVSQFYDVYFYDLLKKKTKGKFLWLRNNASTMVSQLLDNIVFTLIAFIGVLEWSLIIQIFFVSYVMKFIVATLDTPFLYWSKEIKKKYKVD